MNKLIAAIQPMPGGDSPADHFSLKTMIHYGLLACIIGYFLFAFLFLGLGIGIMAVLNLAGCIIFLCAYWLNRRGRPHLALLIGVFEIIFHAASAIVLLGWESSFHYYLVGLIPLIFYSREWKMLTKSILAGFLCLVYLALYIVSYLVPPLFPVDLVSIHALSMVNIITLFFVFAVLSHFYIAATKQAEDGLKRANKKLESLAHTDPLTEIANRREMLNKINLEVERFLWSGTPFSLVMCDIDHFKEYNDTFGHEAGDVILIKAADLLRSYIRDQDRVARWGGEEFLILLPDTGQASAGQIAERLREKVAATCIEVGAGELYVTMTFGVATYHSLFSDQGECIRRADRAMYAGKRRGKNCVMMDEDHELIG